MLDDWGLAAVEGQAANDLMDVIDDRAGVRSTIVASQLPVARMAPPDQRPEHRRRAARPPRTPRRQDRAERRIDAQENADKATRS